MDVTRTFQTLPMDASMMISVRIVRTIPSGGRVGGWTEEEMRPKRATQDSGACWCVSPTTSDARLFWISFPRSFRVLLSTLLISSRSAD